MNWFRNMFKTKDELDMEHNRRERDSKLDDRRKNIHRFLDEIKAKNSFPSYYTHVMPIEYRLIGFSGWYNHLTRLDIFSPTQTDMTLVDVDVTMLHQELDLMIDKLDKISSGSVEVRYNNFTMRISSQPDLSSGGLY